MPYPENMALKSRKGRTPFTGDTPHEHHSQLFLQPSPFSFQRKGQQGSSNACVEFGLLKLLTCYIPYTNDGQKDKKIHFISILVERECL